MFDLFQLPEQHRELRAAIRARAEKEIAPDPAHVDENARLPRGALNALNAFESELGTTPAVFVNNLGVSPKAYRDRFRTTSSHPDRTLSE